MADLYDKKVYRVINLGRQDTRLPGGSTVTGWWTSEVKSTLNLIRDIVEATFAFDGGFPWEDELIVLVASQGDCEISQDGPRTGPYNPRYDTGELFVTAVSRYERFSWRKFAQAMGEDPDKWV